MRQKLRRCACVTFEFLVNDGLHSHSCDNGGVFGIGSGRNSVGSRRVRLTGPQTPMLPDGVLTWRIPVYRSVTAPSVHFGIWIESRYRCVCVRLHMSSACECSEPELPFLHLKTSSDAHRAGGSERAAMTSSRMAHQALTTRSLISLQAAYIQLNAYKDQ